MQDRVHIESERLSAAVIAIRDAFRAHLPKIKGKGAEGYFRVARCWRSTDHNTVIAFDCAKQIITIRRSGWGCDVQLQYIEQSSNIGEGFKLLAKRTPYSAHFVERILDEIVRNWADLMETYPAAQWYGNVQNDDYFGHYWGAPRGGPKDKSKLWEGITVTSLKQLGSTHMSRIDGDKHHYWDGVGDYEGSDTFNTLAEQFVLERGYKWCIIINKFREELEQFCAHKRKSPENFAEFARQVETFAN